ncbi:hypothetical protein LAZ29_10555 [Cereibacter sphaeroides]|uniref:hypothetical protein n=1 Tax=Cereibacter sphaeroides TaxID=1063 RepID=UPI001F2CBC8B|nr:hypothetical protein [Cereibacter sphaeroides]MCE6951371.1 hypothetical protein [Cereibacter sphaeroides]
MRVPILPALLVGLAACLGLEVAALAAGAAPPGDGPFLVVSAPWGGGPAGVIAAAGGEAVGPAGAPMAMLAGGASVEALRAAGAWAVLSPAALDLLCNPDR